MSGDTILHVEPGEETSTRLRSACPVHVLLHDWDPNRALRSCWSNQGSNSGKGQHWSTFSYRLTWCQVGPTSAPLGQKCDPLLRDTILTPTHPIFYLQPKGQIRVGPDTELLSARAPYSPHSGEDPDPRWTPPVTGLWPVKSITALPTWPPLPQSSVWLHGNSPTWTQSPSI